MRLVHRLRKLTGSGVHCGWQIWRVERLKDGTYATVELERRYVGQMFGGDCYVILYTYVARGRENHIVYYWLVCLSVCHVSLS